MTVAGLGLDWEGVDSDLLDCVDDNLAVLLKHRRARDVRTPFACQWHFAFAAGGDPAVSLRRSPATRLVEELTGCRVERHRYDPGTFLRECAALVERDLPPLVYGDAFHMRWLPYHGNQHMEHSFLIDGVAPDLGSVHVVDAYANATEWGAAMPTATELSAGELRTMVAALETPRRETFLTLSGDARERPFRPQPVLAENGREMRRQLLEADALRGFAGHHAERRGDASSLEAFVLGCWLVLRARNLHRRWLEDVEARAPGALPAGFAERFENEVVAAWRRVNELAYVASRRVRRGHPAPDSCFRMVEEAVHPAELALAGELEGTA